MITDFNKLCVSIEKFLEELFMILHMLIHTEPSKVTVIDLLSISELPIKYRNVFPVPDDYIMLSEQNRKIIHEKMKVAFSFMEQIDEKLFAMK